MAEFACRALVLDLDDTLYLERDYALSGLAHVAARMFAGELRETIHAALLDAFEKGDRSRVFDRALGVCRIEASPEKIARMVALYRSHRPHIALASDAVRLFKRLPPALPRALVSDGFAVSQANKVEALGLRDHIDEIVLTDMLAAPGARTYWKPHPLAFERIERRFGLSGSDLVYVADNPAKDFVAPKRLGWRTVRISRPLAIHRADAPSRLHAADVTISSLDDLDAVLAHVQPNQQARRLLHPA